jgi:hypothetical protein
MLLTIKENHHFILTQSPAKINQRKKIRDSPRFITRKGTVPVQDSPSDKSGTVPNFFQLLKVQSKTGLLSGVKSSVFEDNGPIGWIIQKIEVSVQIGVGNVRA